MNILDAMKITRDVDNALFTLIHVVPWPSDRLSATVDVHQMKRDLATGAPINEVHVWYGQTKTTSQIAYEYAMAILRAVDIARQLERDGAIILEGESEDIEPTQDIATFMAANTDEL